MLFRGTNVVGTHFKIIWYILSEFLVDWCIINTTKNNQELYILRVKTRELDVSNRRGRL